MICEVSKSGIKQYDESINVTIHISRILRIYKFIRLLFSSVVVSIVMVILRDLWSLQVWDQTTLIQISRSLKFYKFVISGIQQADENPALWLFFKWYLSQSFFKLWIRSIFREFTWIIELQWYMITRIIPLWQTCVVNRSVKIFRVNLHQIPLRNHLVYTLENINSVH